MLDSLKFLEDLGLEPQDMGKYFKVVCPACKQREGYVFKDYPYKVNCNRRNECNVVTNLKNTGTVVQSTPLLATVPSLDLEKELDTYKSLLPKSVGMEYLYEKRKISKEVIEACDIGWDGKESLVYGIRTHEGHLTALKFRNIHTKDQFQKGGNSGTFELSHTIFTRPLIITEGETDALSAYTLGFKNVLCFRGANFQDKEIDELLEQNPETKIAFLADQDKAGLEAQERWAEKYGYDRCYPVKLPYKDLNECLVKGITNEEIRLLIGQAEPYQIPGITSVTEVQEELKKDPEVPLVMFPTQEMNYLLGGLYAGEVSILSGVPACGKTSYMMGLAKSWANNHDSVVVCPLETSKKRLTKQYLQNYKDEGMLNFFEPVSNKLFIEPLRLTKYFQSLKDRFGMKIFFLDHLEWVAQEQKEEQHKATDTIMKNFVTACKATGTHAILLHHLRRGTQFPRADGTVVSRKPMMQDLSYAGDKIAANVFFIHRNIDSNTNTMDNTGLAELILSKNRSNGNTGSVVIEYSKILGGYQV